MFGSMMTIGLMLRATDGMSSVVAGAASKTVTSLSSIQTKMQSISESAEKFGRRLMADGMLVTGSLNKPLGAFADLEAATKSLEVAMMNRFGEVPAQFAEISRQANELGNVLPGNTADFIASARALKEQGTALDTIVNGGLTSASYLGVLLEIPAADAAEMVAKLREAYGLADNELEKMADLTQRARFAFGMNPQDMKTASSYSASTQNALGLKGLDEAKKLLAMQGMGAGVSIEGSSWGTNFAALLQRLATGPRLMEEAKKGMRAAGRDILEDLGLTLNFFDDRGNFRGLEAMMVELEKLKTIEKSKYGMEGAQQVSHALFGSEAGRIAQMLSQKGVSGYQAALRQMEEQASLQQRINSSLTTMQSKWESLAGTATNALAGLGRPIADLLGPAIVWLNEFVGGPLMRWIDANSQLVGVVGTMVLALGLLLLTLGGVGMLASSAAKAISGGITAYKAAASAVSALSAGFMRLAVVQRAQVAVQNLQNAIAYRGGVWQALQYAMMTTRYRLLEMTAAGKAWVATTLAWGRANLTSAAGLRGLATAFGTSLLTGVKSATVAVRAFSLALLANPITWVVAAFAGAAVLIWKYWKPISGFFAGLWEGIKTGLGPLAPAFQAFADLASAALSPVLKPLEAVWDWLKKIFTQVEDTGGGARKMGVAVGEAIGKAIVWVAKLGKAVFELPGKFFDAGVALVKGLIRGIESMAAKPVEAIKKIGSATANAFKDLLGIRSPSRVFMGFGGNISQGAALGIERGLPQAQKAVGRLADLGVSSNGPVAVGPVQMPRQGAAGAGAGALTVHFSPTIQVHGGGDAGGQVRAALADGYREFESNMRRFVADQQRRAF